MKLGLIALFLLSSLPIHSHELNGRFSKPQICSRSIYKESYFPGTYPRTGHVRSWVKNQLTALISNRYFYPLPNFIRQSIKKAG